MPAQVTRSAQRRLATTLLVSLALLAGLGAPPTVRAATTYYVGPGGGSGGCASPAYRDIQPAVDAAASGDDIHLCAGTYSIDATITVSKGLGFWGDGATATVIDGGDEHRIIYATGSTISLSGVGLRGGLADAWGGGIYATGSVTVADSR